MPIAQLVHHEILNGTAGPSRLKGFEGAVHVPNQALQTAQDPAVNFRAVRIGHLRLTALIAIRARIQGEEIVGVVKGAKKLALHFTNARHIKFEVVRRALVIMYQRVASGP